MSSCACSGVIVIGQKISWPIQLLGVDLNTLGGQFISHLVDTSGQYLGSFTFEVLDQSLNLGKAIMSMDTSNWLGDYRAELDGTVATFDILLETPAGAHYLISPPVFASLEKSPTLSTLTPPPM